MISGPQHPRYLDSLPSKQTSRENLANSERSQAEVPETHHPQPGQAGDSQFLQRRAGVGPYRVAAVELSAFGQTGLGLRSALHLLHDALDVASGDPMEEHGWGAERTRIVFGAAPHYFHKHTLGALSSSA